MGSGWGRRMTTERSGEWLAGFDPANFSLVMGTELSPSCPWRSASCRARVMFGLNLLAYLIIWAVVLARVAVFPRVMLTELGSASSGPGFLTAVAATGLIGVQLHELTSWRGAAAALWCLGDRAVALARLWLPDARDHPRAETGAASRDKRRLVAADRLDPVARGAWYVRRGLAAAARYRHFICLALHLLGVMLYIIVIVLVFDRWMFFQMPPEMLSPTYWINAGAVAITTLAGTRLITSGAEPARR